MAEMKLIVRGVPNGQQTWGMDADDENYINQFYTGGSDGASVNMLVEVRQSGGRQYCYYTYRKNGTVDAQGRSGGYFALSLRMNCYHSDVVGIYYLLDRFYKKCIDGSLLIATEGKVKFAKADFASYGSLFEGIRAKLADIVSTISKNSYAVPLAGFASNGQNKAFEANLLDCEDMENVKAYVKKGGKMCVSATCPRGREKKSLMRRRPSMKKS